MRSFYTRLRIFLEINGNHLLIVACQPGTLSSEFTAEETEEVPEELPEFTVPDELVPLDGAVLLDGALLLDGVEVLLTVAELFEFDVEESFWSCSVPLLVQPVTVHARSAQTAAEMISFFILYSLSYTNISVIFLCCAFATLIFYTKCVKNTIEKSEN